MLPIDSRHLVCRILFAPHRGSPGSLRDLPSATIDNELGLPNHKKFRAGCHWALGGIDHKSGVFMTIRNGFLLTTSLLAASACATSEEPDTFEATTDQAVTLTDRINQCSADPSVVLGNLSVDTCVGADLFFRETFNGHGRSCGTFHRVDRNLSIVATFMATLGSNDPLFVAEFNPNLI